MIIFVEGKIGSGKTYWAVNYLLNKYYVWNDAIHDYVSRYPDLKIITNIDNLKIPHISLSDALSEHGLSTVFSSEWVGSAHAIFIIDEAQRIFDKRFQNKDVFGFFQLSRHFGVDIILITQDIFTCSRELQNLSEYSVKAQPRSRSAKKMFRYSWLSDGESFRMQTLKFDKRVGNMYQSRVREETMKVPLVWRRYVVYLCLGFLVGGLGLYFVIRMYDSDTPRVFSSGTLASSGPSPETASGRAKQRTYLDPRKAMEAYKQNEANITPVKSGDDERREKKQAGRSERANEYRQGFEVEHEPLEPVRCYEEPDGWRVCYEGHRAIGRYQVKLDFSEKSWRDRAKLEKDDRYLERSLVPAVVSPSRELEERILNRDNRTADAIMRSSP